MLHLIRKTWAVRALAAVVLAAGWSIVAAPAHALPPGWGYELVSPLDTNGRDINWGAGSADGLHAWVNAVGPLQGSSSTGNSSTLAAIRTPLGWTTRELADSSQPSDIAYNAVATSEDESTNLVTVCNVIITSCHGSTLFQIVTADNQRSTVLEVPQSGPGAPGPNVMGTSSDLSTFVVQTPPGEPAILPEDTHAQGTGLYLVQDGVAQFIGRDENGAVIACGAVLGNDVSNTDVNTAPGSGFDQSGVSADGHTAFYEGPDPHQGCPDPTELYMWHDGQTTRISVPSQGPDNGATFVGASRDGATVFLTTTTQLVSDDTDSANDLYAYDVATHTFTRLAPGGNVVGGTPVPVTVSPNGDFVYFVTDTAVNGVGTDGHQNLWVYHAGDLELILDTDAGFFELGEATTSRQPSFTTPDGRHMLFPSSAPIPGADPGGTFQLFEVDGLTRDLVCITCHPDGSPPLTDVTMTFNLPGLSQRPMSDDGSVVAFQTIEPLLTQDTNGNGLDVYVWRNGTLDLISGGNTISPSNMAGVSADGRSVFFTSYDRLVPNVTQDNLKLYVARADARKPPVPPSACDGDECQPGPAPDVAPPFLGSLLPPVSGGPGAPKRVGISHLTARLLRRLATSGRLTVTLTAPKAGTLHVRLRARIHGRWVIAASADRTVRKGGTVRVTLRLSHRARVRLATLGKLRLRLTASLSTVAGSARTLTFTVRVPAAR